MKITAKGALGEQFSDFAPIVASVNDYRRIAVFKLTPEYLQGWNDLVFVKDKTNRIISLSYCSI